MTMRRCYKKLATLPGVQRITSTIVMKRIVDNQPLPLPGTRSRKARAAPGRGARRRQLGRAANLESRGEEVDFGGSFRGGDPGQGAGGELPGIEARAVDAGRSG